MLYLLSYEGWQLHYEWVKSEVARRGGGEERHGSLSPRSNNGVQNIFCPFPPRLHKNINFKVYEVTFIWETRNFFA